MGDTDAKIKHSKRRHSNETAAHKQAKIAKTHGVEVETEHRYNKHHALDCGNPECAMCGNPRHIHKHSETIQEKSFNQKKLHEE